MPYDPRMMKRTNWLIVVGIALGLLVPAGTANAAPALARLFLRVSYLRFSAPTDRPVDLTLFLNDEGVVTLRDDFGRITPGPGCVAVSAREVECDHPAAGNVDFQGSPFDDLVHVRFAPPRGFSGFGGEGDDQFLGQAGDERFEGNSGNDELRGRRGDDRLTGDDGDDRLFGGSGDDELEPLNFTKSPDGADEFSGGDGRDSVRYYAADSVSVSLNDVADDGMIGEHDNVLSDVEDITGTTGDDVLEGDGDANFLGGELGSDVLIGGGGDDRLGGRRGDDTLVGGQGNDRLFGGEDHDDLSGRRGGDKLVGEEGNDSLIGGGGHDDLFGRPGNDHLDTVDDVADRAVCGTGIDVATVDAKDYVSASCETVNVVA